MIDDFLARLFSSALLIAVVIVLIFDISHPQVGLIQIGQQPLEDLQQSIRANQPINR